MIDSRAIIGVWRSATRRTIILALVIVSIAVNLASGAFARYAHAHDHEHGQQHTHDHGDTHKHADDDDDDHADGTALITPPSGTLNSGSFHDALHEHGATVILACVQVDHPATLDIVSSLGASQDRTMFSDVKHQLERPPRHP